jgi:GT2 family glycosyltransferase
MSGAADHVMRGFAGDSSGYRGSLTCAREVSAVTAACLMVKRSDYEQIGGFDETYGTHLQDVDFCLKLIELGKRNIFAPRARLLHHESLTRSTYYDMGDHELFLRRWHAFLQAGDPYYNPGFDRRLLNYSLSI